MELKNFFAQDVSGNALDSPTVYVYQAGTVTIATGLKNAAGAALANPFTASNKGQIQFAAPDGDYDMRVTKGLLDYTMRVRFIDATEQVIFITAAKNAAAASEAAAAASAASAATSAASASSVLADTYTKSQADSRFASTGKAIAMAIVFGG